MFIFIPSHPKVISFFFMSSLSSLSSFFFNGFASFDRLYWVSFTFFLLIWSINIQKRTKDHEMSYDFCGHAGSLDWAIIFIYDNFKDNWARFGKSGNFRHDVSFYLPIFRHSGVFWQIFRYLGAFFQYFDIYEYFLSDIWLIMDILTNISIFRSIFPIFRYLWVFFIRYLDNYGHF